MGQLLSGGALVTGATIVDESVGADDLSATALSEYMTDALTLFPHPVYQPGTGTTGVTVDNLTTNTTLRIALFSIDHRITVNKVSFRVSTKTADGTVKFAIFSEDGQTRHISGETATISAGGVITTTLGAPVTLPAGNYYIAALPVGTFNYTGDFWAITNGSVQGLTDTTVGEPVLAGTVTVTASTMPSTIAPVDIVDGGGGANALLWRLDN